jgi:hypothetical protein
MRIVRTIRELLRPHPSPRPRKRTVRARLKPSDPFLESVWRQLRAEYFPERGDLDDYTIRWSGRAQRRVLASCNIRRRQVLVAQELFEPAACQWISPVLFHELCHAVLGESVITPEGRRLWHGSAFRELEAKHPDIPALNLWIKSGGWAMAVRSHRARAAWKRRNPG